MTSVTTVLLTETDPTMAGCLIARTREELAGRMRQRHRDQVRAGQRFAFGENWQRFLGCLDEARLAEAERSLCQMLQREDLRGLTFLDVGCGSGLFSLAAQRLGAAAVHSFDFDPQGVDCARTLKQRYCPQADHWSIEGGDVLDADYLQTLGRYDVVYSWGVLHQTGRLWQALEHVAGLVAPQGLLFLSLYNHQPLWTPCWRLVKWTYNQLPAGFRGPLVWSYLAAKVSLLGLRDLGGGRPPWWSAARYGRRGMSLYHDAVDWIGGYPFETASPEAVLRFFDGRRFQPVARTTVGRGSGCNQFVFRHA